MPIVKGNVASNTFTGTSGSVTHNLSASSGNNRLVVVALTYADYGSAVPTVTYDGYTLTAYSSLTNGAYKTKQYYVLDSSLPSTSGNKTVSVSFNSSPNAGGTALTVCDWVGVKQQSPEASNTASSNTPVSCILTTLTNNACVISCGGGVYAGSNMTAGNSATMDVTVGNSTAQCCVGISEYIKTTAGSNTSSFSSAYGALNIIALSFEESSLAVPALTIQSYDVTKISTISGKDVCSVTFRSDVNLLEWEARAGGSGNGTGLLVDSGSTINANTDTVFTVENEELTQGDQTYRINVYGRNAVGWSNYG